jgi:hypothetical protein
MLKSVDCLYGINAEDHPIPMAFFFSLVLLFIILQTALFLFNYLNFDVYIPILSLIHYIIKGPVINDYSKPFRQIQ